MSPAAFASSILVAAILAAAGLGGTLPADGLQGLNQFVSGQHGAECTANIAADHCADSLEAMFGKCRVHRISAARTDAEYARGKCLRAAQAWR